MAATIRGTYHFVRHSSPFGDRTEFGDEAGGFERTDTLPLAARYFYGLYATDYRDSILVAGVPTSKIDWVADSLFVRASWRSGIRPSREQVCA